MTNKYTPGPWSVNDVNPSDIYGYEAGTKRGRFIAGTINYGAGNCCHTEEDRANAALIAAAPVLLAALENARKWAVEYYGALPWIEEAEAAIKKAKGE